jgi:hypothetical protein
MANSTPSSAERATGGVSPVIYVLSIIFLLLWSAAITAVLWSEGTDPYQES